MEAWKHDFIEGLIQGKPPEYLARNCSGLPLAAVQSMRDTDPEFNELWEHAVKYGRTSGRVLDAASLESILWSQCEDEEAASYFCMKVEEFKEIIDADPALKKIYEVARKGGRAAIKKAQFHTAMDGDRTMLTWLGKQHLGQADGAQAAKEPNMVVNFNISNPGESYRKLLGGGTLADDKVIDAQFEEVAIVEPERPAE